MYTRDGSTSTYSTSGSGVLDHFPVLTPLNPYDLHQSATSTISASTINKYFDAAVRLQNSYFEDLGAATVSTYPDNSHIISNTDLQVSYELFSISLTSNTTTITGTVPSQFGSDPFHDPGFSMSPTFYYGSSDLGVWANLSNPDFGPINILYTKPQFFVSITPVTGRTYIAKILNVPFHATAQNFGVTNFTDNFVSDPIVISQDYRYISGAMSGLPFQTVRSQYLQCASTQTAVTCGVLGCRSITCLDSSIEFGPVTVTHSQVVSGLPVNRSGPALRITYNTTNFDCSFYALSIGDVIYGTHTNTTARVLRVDNCNISEQYADSANNWDLSGSVTDLSPVTLPDLGNATYTAFNFSVSGGLINLQYQTAASGSTWINFAGFPVTDPTPLIGFSDNTAYSGFFSKSMRGTNTLRYTGSAFNCCTIRGPITIGNIGNVVPISCGLGVLYFSINDAGLKFVN